ncbi:MAG: DHHA1 domain-containing protein [Planctomycetota bacterium]
MNAERQAIEARVKDEAIRQVETHGLANKPVIVVAGEGWHPGVVGIVAGRMKEKYDRPVIVIGVENGIGKGSGRSIEGVDLGAAVSAARADGLLSAGGGHAMAAGLTVDEAMLDQFTAFLETRLADAVAQARAARTFTVDAVVSAASVSKTLADRVAQAGPFGPANAEPRFVLADMRVASAKIVGDDHLALVLKSEAGESVRAIAFRAEGEPLGDVLSAGGRLHVAGKIRADDWRGGDAAQLQIEDAAPAL